MRFVCFTVIGFGILLAVGLPAHALSQASGSEPPATSAWLQGWPMVGHDPQRTNRSPLVGPTHPRLLFTHRGFSATLVGPDGSLYGWSQSEPGIAALDASGRTRWVIKGCCGEGYPALAPDGILFDTGSLMSSPSDSGNGTTALAVRPDGSVAWRIEPFGLPKGAVALVSADSLLYAPVLGPHNGTGSEPYIGLNVVSPQGQVLHHLAETFTAPALAVDGTIYDGKPLRAIAPDGTLLWRHDIAVSVGPIVGQSGSVYVGYGSTLAAYSSAGARLWKLHWRDSPLALAERADGILLVAGRTRLGAVSADGKRLWGLRIGKTVGQFNRPSLVVDSRGTAYVGTGDGKLRIISRSGRLLSSISVGPPSRQEVAAVPTSALGPDGRLAVNGTDGILRVYGS